MERVIAGVVLLAVAPLCWWQMLAGWRNRARTQAERMPPPAPVADTAWREDDEAVTGTYVSTVVAGQPFERVAAHGLGSRSLVELRAEPVAGAPALVLRRPGAASFAVPAADLVGVHRAQGQAGKVMFGKEDLVVVTWRLGGPEGAEVETAVRTKPQQDAPRLVALVEALVPRTGTEEAA